MEIGQSKWQLFQQFPPFRNQNLTTYSLIVISLQRVDRSPVYRNQGRSDLPIVLTHIPICVCVCRDLAVCSVGHLLLPIPLNLSKFRQKRMSLASRKMFPLSVARCPNEVRVLPSGDQWEWHSYVSSKQMKHTEDIRNFSVIHY